MTGHQLYGTPAFHVLGLLFVLRVMGIFFRNSFSQLRTLTQTAVSRNCTMDHESSHLFPPISMKHTRMMYPTDRTRGREQVRELGKESESDVDSRRGDVFSVAVGPRRERFLSLPRRYVAVFLD